MFGYLLPYRPGLNDEQFSRYRAHYCGLCHQMGKSFGLVSRLTLSYDFAFLSLIYSSLDCCDTVLLNKRCIFNPIKKHPAIKETSYSDFCAAIAIIMAYYKCRDNIEDSGFLKSIPYRFFSLMLKYPSKKARIKVPQIYEAVDKMYSNQISSEKDEFVSLDSAADPTGEILSFLSSFFSKDSDQTIHLNRLGYMLGRFIYLCDALDDMADDKKNNCFNPFFTSSYVDLTTEEIYEKSQEIFNVTLTEIIDSYRQIKFYHNSDILDNFIYFGLENTCKAILKKRKEADNG